MFLWMIATRTTSQNWKNKNIHTTFYKFLKFEKNFLTKQLSWLLKLYSKNENWQFLTPPSLQKRKLIVFAPYMLGKT
jgi:hypothetical protein